MLIKIVEVNIETQKGKTPWSKAAVVHMVNGQQRTQNVMSFTNPKVFQTVKEMQPGEEYDVTVIKNDKGYNEWSSITKSTGDAAPANKAAGSTTVRSTYETPEERKLRQLYIIRQSSISNAIELYTKVNVRTDLTLREHTEYITELAQGFVDFVYQSPDNLFDEPNDLPD